MDDSQARIKISGRYQQPKIHNDTLMAESEEELKSLLMRVKEKSEKADLTLNIKKKTKIMASGPSLHGKQMWEKIKSDRLYFLRLQNHCW